MSAKVERAVSDYVSQTRGWPRNSYRIESNPADGSYAVIPNEVAAGLIVGCDQAFMVGVDANPPRVVKEWGCQ